MSNNGYTGFIEDGYTLKGFIKSSKEWRYPELNFEYRPMIGREAAVWTEKIRTADDVEEAERYAHEVIAQRLDSWDLKHKGKVLDISKENVSRMEQHLGARLLNVVMGWAPDDSSELSGEKQLEKDEGN